MPTSVAILQVGRLTYRLPNISAMKIATFNVNGINRRIDQLLRWLASAAPDAVCLQELKAEDRQFPAAALREAGYGAIWHGQATWNGVAILARGSTPIETRRGLPGGAADTQSRYIEAAVNGILVGCLYLPNGNPQPGPKFSYKLDWFERFNRYAATLISSGHPVALCGDFNVVPTDFDIYNTRSWKKDALLQPASRAAFSALLKQGWTDAIREKFPMEPMYTFWDYFRNHWQTNSGLRIDHLLLSPELNKRLLDAGVDRDLRGEDHPSDHAPAWIVLKDSTEHSSPRAKRTAARKPERRRAPR
jgi:exodeoxyribonuclease-3